MMQRVIGYETVEQHIVFELCQQSKILSRISILGENYERCFPTTYSIFNKEKLHYEPDFSAIRLVSFI